MDKKSDAKIISEFMEYQKLEGNSESTLKLYIQIIDKFNEWLLSNDGSLDNITRFDIQQYINHLSDKGLSASTIENKFAAIVSLVKFLGRIDILQNIRKPKYIKTKNIAPKSLEKKDRNKLLREIERTGNLRNIAITYMFLYTGIRVSELAFLDKKDITLKERSGIVIVKKGKGNLERKIPLPIEARIHLKNYLDARTDYQEALFLSNYKKRMSVRSIQRVFEKYDVYPHQLRHTYCRELISAGIDIAIVAELAGHSDINITKKYSKPSRIEIEKAIEKAFY